MKWKGKERKRIGNRQKMIRKGKENEGGKKGKGKGKKGQEKGKEKRKREKSKRKESTERKNIAL